MTKSLLTSQDIKNFILQEINKIDTRQEGCFSLMSIAKKLGVSYFKLRRLRDKIKIAYVKNKSTYYNIDTVIKFLNDHNIEFDYQYSIKLRGVKSE